jgi:LmbE family N-acetylglucosaminyl deacetylase
MTSLLVVSPHLDDAVFSCGELLASHPGAVVVTVFAGIPPDTGVLPEWDATCGFATSRQAVMLRRREDRAALEVLDAEPCWLNFLDSQYRRASDTAAIALKLARALRRHDAQTIAVPLGLFHEDHKSAHQAALRLLRSSHGKRWIAYEDALYRRIPGLVDERLAQFDRQGIRIAPEQAVPDTPGSWRKRSAIECYQSQLRGLESAGRPGHADLLAPERYWRLSA